MMKKFIAALILILIFAPSCFAVNENNGHAVKLGRGLPKTYKEFKARYNNEAKSPEAAVKLYFEAVFAYTEAVKNKSQEWQIEAGKMIRYAIHYDTPIEKSYNLATFADRLKDPESAHIFRSFLEGTSPENNYTPSGGMESILNGNFKLMFNNYRKQENDYLRLSLRSSGSDSQRIVWVKKFDDDGLWYTINITSTYVQVKEPKVNLHAHDADYD